MKPKPNEKEALRASVEFWRQKYDKLAARFDAQDVVVTEQAELINRQRETIDSFLAERAAWGLTQCENLELRERIKALEEENKDLKAALVEARGNTYPQPKQGWQCFHCGEWFTTRKSAESHFGKSPQAERIKALETALDATDSLVCGRDQHTLGCGCACWVCKKREKTRAVLEGK